MVRTCSQALLGVTAVVGLTALSGCTVYTYEAPPPRRVVVVRERQPHGTHVRRTPTSTPAPDPTAPAPVNAPLITSPNAFGSATAASFRGLAYVIPTNTGKMPSLDGLVPFATLYTDSFDISAQPFNVGFPGALRQSEWFAIRFEGAFNIPAAGPCTFDVISDDGAILYVDGQQVVTNDGIHTPTKATGKTTLGAGLHQLRLDYFKGAQGTIALRVFVTVGNNPQNLLVGVRPK